MSSARAGLSPCIVPIREAASGRRIAAVIPGKRRLPATAKTATFSLVIDLRENPTRSFSSSRLTDRLEWKVVPWSELARDADVFEASGKMRIGLFVANNPVNWSDPDGLLTICSGWTVERAGVTSTYEIASTLISQRQYNTTSRQIRGVPLIPPGAARAAGGRYWGGIPQVRNVLVVETWRVRVWQRWKFEEYTVTFYRMCIDTCTGQGWKENMDRSKTGKYGIGTRTETELIGTQFF